MTPLAALRTGTVRARTTITATLRQATIADVPAIDALIREYAGEARLLPRHPAELAAHAGRFVVAEDGGEVVGCADLARLGPGVAEVRSLVVARHARAHGVGRQLLTALVERATRAGIDRLCAFTHRPEWFVHHGFSLVPHTWLPEKIATDCRDCAQFRNCGQYAVLYPCGPETVRPTFQG